jgi:hypothetical protein
VHMPTILVHSQHVQKIQDPRNNSPSRELMYA